jgi:hypothetical protein
LAKGTFHSAFAVGREHRGHVGLSIRWGP